MSTAGDRELGLGRAITRRDFLNGVAIGASSALVTGADEPEWAPGRAPHEIGRRPIGRITIANSDAGATAYPDVASDQAHRAVTGYLADAREERQHRRGSAP